MNEHNPVFFPGLNGLRAIAALAVVVSHTTVGLGAFQLNSHLFGTLSNGNPKGLDLSDFAVSVFFALSGFLITYLLLVEGREAAGINVKKFYIRRILRIWPLYYAYYLLASLAIVCWQLPDNPGMSFFYIFFSANVPKVLQLKSELLGHYWSLGVEEQFYLFWPWVVMKARKNLLKTCIVLLFILFGAKLAAHFIFPGTYFETAMYVNRFDCMLVGGVGAVLYFQRNTLFIKTLTHPVIQAGAWLCVVLAALNHFHLAGVLDHEIMSTCTVTLIVGQATAKKEIVNLDRPFFDFLGKMSYGIYVIHPIIIFGAARFLALPEGVPESLRYVWAYASVLGLTLLLAYCSYEYLEKRFLKIKTRFATVESRAERDRSATSFSDR